MKTITILIAVIFSIMLFQVMGLPSGENYALMESYDYKDGFVKVYDVINGGIAIYRTAMDDLGNETDVWAKHFDMGDDPGEVVLHDISLTDTHVIVNYSYEQNTVRTYGLMYLLDSDGSEDEAPAAENTTLELNETGNVTTVVNGTIEVNETPEINGTNESITNTTEINETIEINSTPETNWTANETAGINETDVNETEYNETDINETANVNETQNVSTNITGNITHNSSDTAQEEDVSQVTSKKRGGSSRRGGSSPVFFPIVNNTNAPGPIKADAANTSILANKSVSENLLKIPIMMQMPMREVKCNQIIQIC